MTDRPLYPAARLDYDLPPELIAQQPARERSGSRMLYVNVQAGRWHDRMFTDLPELLPQRTLICLNDTAVLRARILGHRASGGQVEVFYLETLDDGVIKALVRSNANLKSGEVLDLGNGLSAELLEPKSLEGCRLRIRFHGEVLTGPELDFELEERGQTPLPPYIKPPKVGSKEEDRHRERYQTVYAARLGSVAAPTAGLHFTEKLLGRLRRDGHQTRMLTLHVGLGTFAPLRVDDLRDHVMHEEPYSVKREVAQEYLAEHEQGRPILAVGTTSLRILHTLLQRRGGTPSPPARGQTPDEFPAQSGGRQGGPPTVISGRTSAFIYPGHGTDAARLLLTNFHLPRSTLLALVYAFGGEELLREVYAHAVRERYRFFSYGDCMLIDRGRE